MRGHRIAARSVDALQAAVAEALGQCKSLGDRFTIACALGGPVGRTLFMLSADTYAPDRHGVRAGTLHVVDVEVPAAGS